MRGGKTRVGIKKKYINAPMALPAGSIFFTYSGDFCFLSKTYAPIRTLRADQRNVPTTARHMLSAR
jgi:hypothetical protein